MKEEILPLLTEKDKEKEEPLKLDLKPLPTELKYAYLEEGDRCPVVISSSLNISQEDDLLGILRKCNKAIGWKISYLKGICNTPKYTLFVFSMFRVFCWYNLKFS